MTLCIRLKRVVETGLSMLRLFLFFTLFLFTLNADALRVGYSTDSFNELSKKDSQIALNLWFKEMMENKKHSAKFSFYDDINFMANDFKAGKLDLVYANGIGFIKYFDTSLLRAAFTGGSIDKNKDNLVIIRKKSVSLEDLKKQKVLKIALIRGENPSNLYAKYMVLKEYKNKDIKYIHTKRNSAAVLKVFFHGADIAIVPRKTFDFAKELNPQVGNKLFIMHQTNITALVLGYYHKSVTKEFRDEIHMLAFKEAASKRGSQMMIIFKTDTLVDIEVNELEPIKNLYKDYLKLKDKSR